MVEVIKVIIPGPQGPAADVDLSTIESQLGVIDSRVAALESQGGQASNDSGPRDVGSLLTPGWYPTGGVNYAVLSRVGRRVTFAARIISSEETPEHHILDVPTGFRPGRYQHFGYAHLSLSEEMVRIGTVDHPDLVSLSKTPRLGEFAMFTVSWETLDPFPIDWLPGVPYVGQEEEL